MNKLVSNEEHPPRNGRFGTPKASEMVMVGAFPPPVHGMAVVNAAVRELFERAGVEVLVLDVAARSQDRSLLARLGRLPRVLRRLGYLVAARQAPGCKLYMSISGGPGQAYEIAFLLAARLRRMPVYLHHHAYSYLDRRRRLTAFLSAIAGSSATHITLSPGMAASLQQNYPRARRAIPVSNALHLPSQQASAQRTRDRLKTLGFLGNISAEKGVFDFIELVAAVEAAGLQVQALLAGPFQDTETERRVIQQLAGLSRIEYQGPKYGEEKESFFASIDVLVFPTRYANEAEPMTIHEAMCRGIPVIAYSRGCISEIVGWESGRLIDPAEPFVPSAMAQIVDWDTSPGLFEATGRAASQRYRETYASSAARWQDLLHEMTGTGKYHVAGSISTRSEV